MGRYKLLAGALFTFVLCIISTTFVFLTLASKMWSVQNFYDSSIGGGSPTAWSSKSLRCAVYRSPFYRCPPPTLAPDNTIRCGYEGCAYYSASGFAQTSCQSPAETGREDSPLNGGAQECQQVHYAGNLQIAAAVFVTLALLGLIGLTLFTVAKWANSAKGGVVAADTTKNDSNAAEKEIQSPASDPKQSPYTPYAVLGVMLCLYAGAFLQILAQLFGILGLTVKATPTQAQATQLGSQFFGASQWTMSTALTAYASVAWTSALACALMIGFVYRTPQFAKYV